MCGAENNTATVAIIVNIVKIIKQNLERNGKYLCFKNTQKIILLES